MSEITFRDILELRTLRNRLDDGRRLRSDRDAADFINQRGMVLLGPVRGLPLPSLSEADEGEPWPDFTVTDNAWRWKEVLPGEKKCAYGKFLRHRGTFLSWDIFPAFFKLYGPESDEEEEYARGRLNRNQLQIVEKIREEGPLDSRELWRAFRLRYAGKRSRFVKDLDDLQAGLLLMVSGGSLEGWSCHQWELVERQAPRDIIEKTPALQQARTQLLACLLANVVACLPREAATLLRFSPRELEEAAAVLPIVEISFYDRKGVHWLWEG